MISRLLIAMTTACLVVACGPGGDTNDNNHDGGHNLPDGWVGPDGASNNNNVNNNNGNWVPPTNSRVYVNTKDTLYYIDPGVSEDLVTIGDFTGTCTTGSGFLDIAVDDQDTLLGISAEGLFEIDKSSAACTEVFAFPELSPRFYALSYVKGVDALDLGKDVLMGASDEGEWVRINWPAENIPDIFIHVGWYDPPDNDWISSGDIVSVQVGQDMTVTYATLKCATGYSDLGCESDALARINPQTGLATIVGLTGYQRIFGLGFWGDKLYGFTAGGEYIHINKDTGAGILVEEFTGLSFWGAGNTTIPHIVQ